ncbi:peptidylprolyl isomerase [Paenibacillus thermoaerophilus]|uniref:Peptidylprolyl isomerase n=1 Tax=Paenibacillus thermoaerophilus TaxID=1215385 RepID=A0ABW2V842_9BACL|nr:peptidylprolyl isomerase [Paenibacillus thermoaerophilus]TMV09459.1 peptidylprolyl isomerase [Paenibacillus thermoaerophilus]
MLRNKKWRITAIALLALTVFAVGCGGKKDLVATYKDGGGVTKAELDKYASVNLLFQPAYEMFKEDPEFQNMLLHQLIGLKIKSEQADSAVKDEVETKLKEQMAEFDKVLKDHPDADKQMKDADISRDDIETFFRRHMLANGVAGKDVKDEDIKKEYDASIAQDPHMFDTASVRHILINFTDPEGKERTKEDALARAKEVHKKLQEGGDFAALAKEYSEDPGSKDNGGLYEDAQVSQWVEAFKKAAIELPLNTISDPVETEYGYHIMKVEKRTLKTFDDVKGEIKMSLADRKLSEFIEKEVPGLIEQNNLPSPTPTPSASPEPTASPSASPAADSTPSPSASPSAS